MIGEDECDGYGAQAVQCGDSRRSSGVTAARGDTDRRRCHVDALPSRLRASKSRGQNACGRGGATTTAGCSNVIQAVGIDAGPHLVGALVGQGPSWSGP
ncbi:hypothetical protein C731_3508 [Mycolicibacterium hassiacum DSM 44199]|uniref:Uncharacterized protein n=1 Tax=Mycolicibacterium hassiacum (strain DSM 44199 / CIP 105218 / JCM 12690 / 3849) TaxID=1122247 RepID=K5BAN1_MYCHD|nr:hypothetical protein C731_3508 [Mycolicibacterium hassiacum DSM 44199]